ncbi:hypothetical protein RUM44_011473 [Polyplax serrata]|uniref:Uncharacterized protein n=1 Tax=Polyplax serrata TaxID=468196 RepID=A0ABR1AQG4_POLSC
MRIAILFLTCLIVVNAVHTRSKASTSKGRGGNSKGKRATAVLQKPKGGAGIPVSRKKRSDPAGEAVSEVSKSTDGNSQASTSKGRGGNSRVKRAATSIQTPKSGDAIGVGRKKRSSRAYDGIVEVSKSTDGSSTKKGKNGKKKNKGRNGQTEMEQNPNIRSVRSGRDPKGTNTDKPTSKKSYRKK